MRTLADFLAPEANSFGILRLLMALAVLVSHSYLFHAGTSSAEPLHRWTGHSLGEHAVQVFFILSGILVAQSFDRSRSVVDFVTGRVLRIFPGLVVCVLLTAFLLGPYMSSLGVVDYLKSTTLWLYLLKTLSLSTGSAPLPGLFEALPLDRLVNMSLWTLKYEVLCYAGLALAGLAGLFRPEWRGVAAAGLALFLAVVFLDQPKAIETYTSLDNIRYFALFFGMGTLAYLVRDKLVVTGWLLAPLALLMFAALGTRFFELATALFLTYLTVCVASFRFGGLNALANRYDLSFGVYIYAGPIQQGIIQSHPDAGPLEITLLALALVVPLAWLSWLLVEHPALKARKTIADRITGRFADYSAAEASEPLSAVAAKATAAPVTGTAPLKSNFDKVKARLRAAEEATVTEPTADVFTIDDTAYRRRLEALMRKSGNVIEVSQVAAGFGRRRQRPQGG